MLFMADYWGLVGNLQLLVKFFMSHKTFCLRLGYRNDNIITFSVPYLFRKEMISAEYNEEQRKQYHINQTPDIQKTPNPAIHGQPRTVPHPA